MRLRYAAPAGLLLLAAASVVLRTVRLDVGYWIDEGLSVGIADRPLLDIPGVMRQDGSPPSYYMLLHAWIRLLGDTGEEATHALSLLLATLAIPVAFLLARALFGTRAGWFAAVFAAFVPFLTHYAQEARMYALVALLAIVSVSCFTGAFALDRGRRWTIGFAVAHAALLWTHNWALFLGAALALAWALLFAEAGEERRRRLLREGLLAAGVIAVLYAPWVPTLLFQVANTGAPWANPPDLTDLARALERLVGDVGQFVLLLGIAAGLGTLLRARPLSAEARAAVALAVVAAATLIVPWLVSQVSPTWATRYTAVAVGPLALVCALTLARAGTSGLVLLVLFVAVSLGENGPREKSNVRAVVREIAPSIRPGDLVISTQPEQVPVLHHYLEAQGVGDLRWATLWGRLTDLGVTDWRGGEDRLEATSPQRDLVPLLDAVEPGGRAVLFAPDFSSMTRWRAPWTKLVRQRSAAWEDWMRNDRRFRVIALEPISAFPPHPIPMRAIVLYREPIG